MLHSGNNYLNNFRPPQENLNIMKMAMFDSPFNLKLLGYVELNCTDLKLAS